MTPLVQKVIAALLRSELSGVNLHTVEVGLARLAAEQIAFENLTERQIAILLLERIGYPTSIGEFSTFLGQKRPLNRTALSAEEITDEHAPHYVRWLAAFLDDPELTTQTNARIVLQWLVANRGGAIAADQSSLDNLRRLADDPATSWHNSAFYVYALGCCGRLDDYDRVIRHAERVIEQDREHLDLVAEGLYRLHPPALISALQFFLENIDPRGQHKQFATAMTLLSRVAEIEDRNFWATYYDEMDGLVARIADFAANNRAVERVLDQIEKNMALAAYDED